jgi:hypothetical protein
LGVAEPAKPGFWTARSVAVALAVALVVLCAVDLLSVLNQQSMLDTARTAIARDRATVVADRAAVDEQRQQQQDALNKLRQQQQDVMCCNRQPMMRQRCRQIRSGHDQLPPDRMVTAHPPGRSPSGGGQNYA